MKFFSYRIHNVNVFLLFAITMLLLLAGLSYSIDNWFSDWAGYTLPKSLFWRINVITRWVAFPIMIITLVPLWIPKISVRYVLISLLVYYLVLSSFFLSYGLWDSIILTIMFWTVWGLLFWKMR